MSQSFLGSESRGTGVLGERQGGTPNLVVCSARQGDRVCYPRGVSTNCLGGTLGWLEPFQELCDWIIGKRLTEGGTGCWGRGATSLC